MGIRKFFQHRKVHGQRIRDLIGIVEGWEFTTKDKSKPPEKKPKPSLLSKIEFVKKRMKEIYPLFERFNKVKGMIITKSYPSISSYKGVKIIGIEEICKL